MTGPEHLSARQQQALRALLEATTIAAAAESCNLSERSLHRYLEDEHFVAQYRRLRARLVDETVASLQKISIEAVGVLRASFEDESASVRLRAARTVLELMFKGTEFADWEERLRRLEEEAVMRRRASSRIARLEAKPRRHEEYGGGQETARAIVERICATEEGREAAQAYATALEKSTGDHNEVVREMLKEDSSREALARLGELFIEAEQSIETDRCVL